MSGVRIASDWSPPKNHIARRRVVALVLAAAALGISGASAAGASAEPLLTAAGDIACDPDSRYFNDGRGTGSGTKSRCRQLATSRLMSDADTVLPIGDNQYEHGSLSNYRRSYDRSWGRYLSITRPVIGNHEYGTPEKPNLGADGYWDYFGEGRAGERDQGWYSFNLGDWHIIALNSHCTSSDRPNTMQRKVGCDEGSPQMTWLRQDLAENQDKKCTLATWHHPRFSSGLSGGWREVAPFWRALQEGGADVVLSAHDHVYERFAPQSADGSSTSSGLREFMVGTGGKNVSKFDSIKRNSQKRVRAHGVLRLQLRADRYRWRFARAGDDATLDGGLTECR